MALGFTITCETHQQRFIAALRARGCTDPEEQERVRLCFQAILSMKYPMAVFRQFGERECIGCQLEAASFSLRAALGSIIDDALAAQRRDEGERTPGDRRRD